MAAVNQRGILLAGNKGGMDIDWITDSVCHGLQRSLGQREWFINIRQVGVEFVLAGKREVLGLEYLIQIKPRSKWKPEQSLHLS